MFFCIWTTWLPTVFTYITFLKACFDGMLHTILHCHCIILLFFFQYGYCGLDERNYQVVVTVCYSCLISGVAAELGALWLNSRLHTDPIAELLMDWELPSNTTGREKLYLPKQNQVVEDEELQNVYSELLKV